MIIFDNNIRKQASKPVNKENTIIYMAAILIN